MLLMPLFLLLFVLQYYSYILHILLHTAILYSSYYSTSAATSHMERPVADLQKIFGGQGWGLMTSTNSKLGSSHRSVHMRAHSNSGGAQPFQGAFGRSLYFYIHPCCPACGQHDIGVDVFRTF